MDGVLVLAVKPGSEAASAGLRPTRRDQMGRIVLGDVIVTVDDSPIHSANDLLDAFEKHLAGDRVTLQVLCDGKKTEVSVVLEVNA